MIKFNTHTARDRVDMISQIKPITPTHAKDRVARDFAEKPSGRALPLTVTHLDNLAGSLDLAWAIS